MPWMDYPRMLLTLILSLGFGTDAGAGVKLLPLGLSVFVVLLMMCVKSKRKRRVIFPLVYGLFVVITSPDHVTSRIKCASWCLRCLHFYIGGKLVFQHCPMPFSCIPPGSLKLKKKSFFLVQEFLMVSVNAILVMILLFLFLFFLFFSP